MFFVRERFVHASRILTEHRRPIKERLHAAFVHHIMHVDRTEVPEDCLSDFDFIQMQLVGDRGRDASQVEKAVERLSDDHARELASRILFICMAMLYIG